jgi:hypothetical protein
VGYISAILLIGWIFVVFGGVVWSFKQAFEHLRSKTPISLKKSTLLRAMWLSAFCVLGTLLMISQSINLDNLVCGGLLLSVICGVILLFGYLLEWRFNRLIGSK